MDIQEPINREDEIRDIWRKHQWLYIVVGIFIGLLLTPFLLSSIDDLLRSLIPEAIGIAFGVIVIDQLYRYFQRRRLQELVKEEILSNISEMLYIVDGQMYPAYKDGMPARKCYGNNGLAGDIKIKETYVKGLVRYIIHSKKLAGRINSYYIENFLNSNLISPFFKPRPNKISLNEALFELRNLLLSYTTRVKHNLSYDEFISNRVYYYSNPINNKNLLEIMYNIDREIDILNWSKNILEALNSDKHYVDIPILRPSSPIREYAENPDPQLSSLQVEEWLLSTKF